MTDRLREATERLIEAAGAYQADQTGAHPLLGNTQPITRAEGEELNTAVANAEAALAEPDVCGWTSVDERLPDFNQVVLAWLVGEENHSGTAWERHGYAFMVRHDDLRTVLRGWSWDSYDRALTKLGADFAEVTHWMPLPEPPGCGRKIEVKE